MELDKYKELYDLCREAAAQAEARFDTIETKAATYLSVLTVLVGAGGFLAKWVADTLIPPHALLDRCLVALAAVTLPSLAVAWWLAFSALRVSRIRVLELDAEMLGFFRGNNLTNIYYAMARGFVEAWETNGRVNGEKLRKLTFAYRTIILLVILMLLFCLLYAMRAWLGGAQ